MEVSKKLPKGAKLYSKPLGIRRKKLSIYFMEHPIAQSLRDLIHSSAKSQKDIALELGIHEKTFGRKMKSGDWRLEELIHLEDVLGVSIFSIGSKNVHGQNHPSLSEPEAEYPRKPRYQIKITIDPEDFRPEDLDQLNADLTRRLLRDFNNQ